MFLLSLPSLTLSSAYTLATTVHPLNRKVSKQDSQPVKARKMENMPTQSNKEQLHAPYEWYRTMRATQPVFNNPDWGGWQVFRYADVARVLNEYATFSSDGHRMAQSGGFDAEADPLESSILRMDPPRHRQLRNLVSQAFTPRMVAQLEPLITTITNELLDHVAPPGEMYLVPDLAYPLPVTVIADLLAIPAD